MRKVVVLSLVSIAIIATSCCKEYDGCKATKKEVAPAVSLLDSLAAVPVSQNRLTPEVLWQFGRVSDAQLSPDGTQVVYGISRYDIATNKSYTDLFLGNVKTGDIRKLTDFSGAEFNQRWNKDGSKIGFLCVESGSSQIWEMLPDGSGKKQISFIDGDINSFEYSPDGTKVLFTMDIKLDMTANEVYQDLPLADVRIIDDLMYRHWNDWHDYKYSHIFVADVVDGKVSDGKDIMPGERWDAPLSPYFDNSEMAWSPDGTYIAYTCKKLTGKQYAESTNSDIYLYEVATAKTENISEGLPGYDKYPRFSPDGKKIAWECMITPGYESDKNRLYVYDFEFREREDITSDFDQNVSALTWAPNSTDIYFISGINGTHQIYKINTVDETISKITNGVHDIRAIGLQGGTMIAEIMSMSMANEVFVINPENGEKRQLTYTNKNIYDKVKMGKVEERWIKTFDGKDMLVWVIFPPDFDPSLKYPAILYCQGGPQSMVSQFFSYRWNFQIMAANDYIVVAPNRRGLPGFGQEWNAQISGDYGGKNMRDYLAAIDEISKETYVDKENLGAVGASYGGYSVYWLAGHHNKRFKAFISHCGMFNLESQYGGTEEFFFVNHDLEGPYWKSPKPKSYNYSPHLFVDKWDTPIMIITGGKDFRIPYTESLQAFNAAKLVGVDARLLYFPEETHFVLKPQNSILWQREFAGWLDKYLKN